MIVVCKGSTRKEGVCFKIREDGVVKFKTVPFKNYFYVKKSDADSVTFFEKHTVEKMVPQGDYVKVILKNNFWRRKCVSKLKECGIKTYEDDINVVKRFYVDNPKIKLNHHGLRKVYMDIETYDYEPLVKDSNDWIIANQPILSIALKDEEGNEYYIKNEALDDEQFSDFKKVACELEKNDYNKLKKLIKQNEKIIKKELIKGEKKLLITYYDIMKNYDLQIAYNGVNFDFTYLKQRMEYHDLNYYDLMLNDLDYMIVFKKDSFMNLKRWGLNKVSEEVFKKQISSGKKGYEEVTKIDWKTITNCKKYFDLFLTHPIMFKEYNMQDVNLMMLIEEELNFVKIHELQSQIAHCPIEDTVFNSRMCDYLMLNEKKKKSMVSESKPDENTVKMRSLIKPGGGYTYCNFPGVWKNVECFDFLSHYPTTMINFNISPEKFVKDVPPKLEEVFNTEEISFIKFCENLAKSFIDKKGKLKKKDYVKRINEEIKSRGLDYNMWDLMWKFVENYNVNSLKQEYPDCVITPADINFDTRGWSVHPHRLFKNDSIGLVSEKIRSILFKRIEIKEEIMFLKKNGDPENKILGLVFMEKGLKILINSFYGYFGFRISRDYLYQIPDSITSSCRFITKKTMTEGVKIGLVPIWGDTDSCYFGSINGEKINVGEVNLFYFNFFKEWFKQFGTIVSFEKPEPLTNNIVEVCHTTEFNHEKSLKNSIDIKKKKYFYLTPNDELKMKGVSALKSDTLKSAGDISIELANSVLLGNFDKVEWKRKILELRKKVYDYELSDEEVFKFVSISKPVSEYGGAVIDGKTGKPKIKKNGEIQYCGVPAHIKLAKRMIENGEVVDVGDKIGYVIAKHKPRIVPISIEEYKLDKRYDSDYYWKNIESSILEVLEVVVPNDVYSFFSECWSHSSKVQERLLGELTERFLSYESISVFGNMSKYCPMKVMMNNEKV